MDKECKPLNKNMTVYGIVENTAKVVNVGILKSKKW
jgi:hypothetical protein